MPAHQVAVQRKDQAQRRLCHCHRVRAGGTQDPHPVFARGRKVEVGAWFDGANPSRANTVQGYIQGMHADWLTRKIRESLGEGALTPSFELVTRFRYNPDVRSLNAMVPAIIPMLLLMDGGRVVDTLLGAQPAPVLRSRIEGALARRS